MMDTAEREDLAYYAELYTAHHRFFSTNSRSRIIASSSSRFKSMQTANQDYITDIDVQQPSPELASFNDLDFANFPNTPPYTGNASYHGSPYSVASDLSYNADESASYIFEDTSFNSRYDPVEYDAPGQSSLFMPDAGFGPGLNMSSFIYNDYSSPSSNGADSANGERRSRASSVSSNPQSATLPTSLNVVPSPRLDVAQTFENLRFESPHWNTHPLPQRQDVSFRDTKPQSPPRLLMPEATSPTPFSPPPPTINAPEGDGDTVGSGPMLHIVPATPVSGIVASHANPFQSRLEALPQGSSLNSQQSSGASSAWDGRTSASNDTLSASFDTYQYGGHSRAHDAGRGQSASPRLSNESLLNGNSPSSSSAHDINIDIDQAGQTNSAPHGMSNGFLFPNTMSMQRLRSKSDTSLDPPNWETDPYGAPGLPNESAVEDGTVNMHDVHGPAIQNHPHHSQLNHNFTFGNTANNPNAGALGSPPNNYLSPDMTLGGAAMNLRRSKSDGSNRPGHVRQSRSEDIRGGTLSPPQGNVNLGSPPLGHHHSQSNNFVFPQTSQQEFLNRQQYLSPQEPRIRGHWRRASSGSRSERGVSIGSADGMLDMGMGMGYGGAGDLGQSGHWSGASSVRASPYPSPNASPRVRHDDLPPGLDASGVSLGSLVAGGMPMGMGGAPGGSGSMSAMQMTVSKPNVTTGRTANASHKRRKQEATFVCPVPGCGSTFTRSFNLKGHIRSHNEEKPFQCHWPGCGKGFARQHDCKRHEQLHTNYRPFTCDGCNKQFARMDALNRHLRSEGGAECQRTLEAAGGPALMDQKGGVESRSPSMPLPKAEEGASPWPSAGAVAL